MSLRSERKQKRLDEAEWNRDLRRVLFIKNYLKRRSVVVEKNICPKLLMDSGNRCILKDFKRVAGGAVGLVWGCDNCSNGPSYIGRLSQGQFDNRNFGIFHGQCRNTKKMGDANQLIIIPRYNYLNMVAPTMVETRMERLITSKGILERTVFHIVQ